jgi:hypothetical protein
MAGKRPGKSCRPGKKMAGIEQPLHATPLKKRRFFSALKRPLRWHAFR